MDPSNGASSNPVKKMEDVPSDPNKPASKPDGKPVVKTLNRVPRKILLSNCTPLLILLSLTLQVPV
jgi:hypothetical protein